MAEALPSHRELMAELNGEKERLMSNLKYVLDL
jgi:hypothetical protein